MSGEIEGMDGCMNFNTSGRDFLSSACDSFLSWGNLEQLDLLLLFFVHYCFTSNCFSTRIIRGGSLPGVSAGFEMWSCIQIDAWDAAGLIACRMHFSVVWCKVVSERKSHSYSHYQPITSTVNNQQFLDRGKSRQL